VNTEVFARVWADDGADGRERGSTLDSAADGEIKT
jgi:hypothetical protein